MNNSVPPGPYGLNYNDIKATDRVAGMISHDNLSSKFDNVITSVTVLSGYVDRLTNEVTAMAEATEALITKVEILDER